MTFLTQKNNILIIKNSKRMSILKKQVNNKFTQIPNTVIEDTEICGEAFRLYCYLLSKPDNWQINNKDVKQKLNINANQTIAKYFKQLLDSGWIVREKAKDSNGHFSGGFDYIIYDEKFSNSENVQMWKNSKFEKSSNYINTDSNTNTDLNNNTENIKNTTYSNDSLQNHQPEKSFSKKSEDIILYWNTLEGTKKHTRSDTKVYKQSAEMIDNLLSGRPIVHKKDLTPTKPLLNFCQRFNISSVYKKFTSDEIKTLLQRIVARESSESLSLREVLWNNMTKRTQGYSAFLIMSDRIQIHIDYKKLAKKLADIVHPGLRKSQLMEWAKQFEIYCKHEECSIEELSSLLDWYDDHYDDQYTPRADDPEEFFEKHKRIQQAQQRTKNKEKKITEEEYKKGEFFLNT